MKVEYRVNAPLRVEEVASLLESSGIRRPLRDLERLKLMMENSNLIISAWVGEKLVGLARALTDFGYCCYLSDLAVRREFQKKGIGRELVHRLQVLLGDKVMILLLSSPEAVRYYPKIGFTRVENAWSIARKQ